MAVGAVVTAQEGPTGSIAGTLTVDGTPSAGIIIRAIAGNLTGQTSPDPSTGAYSITGLQDGSYQVMAFMDSDQNGQPSEGEPVGQAESAPQQPAVIVVTNGSAATGIDFTLVIPPGQPGQQASGGINGTVTVQNGPPQGQIKVRANGPTGAVATADQNGAYSLAGLSAGSYQVEAFDDRNGDDTPDGEEPRAAALDGTAPRQIEVGSGFVEGVGITLDLTASGGPGGPGPGDPGPGDPGPGGPKPIDFGGANATFGGIITLTITSGGSPVNGTAEAFLMPAFDPDSPPPPCEPPVGAEGDDPATFSLGTCSGGRANTTGVITIRGIANGSYDLGIFDFQSGSSLFRPAFINVTGATTTSATYINRTLVLPRPGYVTGTVLTADDAPVPDATVEFFGPGHGMGTTDANGTFNVTISPGKFGVFIMPPSDQSLQNYNPPCDPFGQSNHPDDVCITVTAGNVTGLGTIRLSGGGSITGRLVDTNGDPLQGDINAFSQCMGPGPCNPSFGWTYVAPEDNGDWTIGGLQSGTYVVEANLWQTGQRVVKNDVTVVVGNTTNVGDLVVGGGATVRGVVKDGSGNPLQNVNVIVFEGIQQGEQFGPPGFPLSFSQTDGNGAYRASGLPAGGVTIEFEPPFNSLYKRASQTATVSDGNTTWLNVTMSLGKSVQGQIFDPDGVPVGYAEVGLFPLGPCPPNAPCGGWARANSDGTYLVGGLEAGRYGMFVNPPSGLGLGSYVIDPFTGGDPIAIESGTTTVYRNITLSRGSTIQGNITTSDSGAVPTFLWMNAFGSAGFSGAPVNNFQSASKVEYQLEGLQPGIYNMRLEMPPEGRYASVEVSGVTVTAGSTTYQDFVLSAGLCINGRVTDASNAVQNAFVDAFELIPPGSHKFGSHGFDQTDANGDYNICGLTPGEYGLHVEPQPGSGLSGAEEIGIFLEGQDETQNIQLTSGVPVTGSAVDGNGDPVMGWIGVFSPDNGKGGGGPIQPDGSFNISVAPGTYFIDIFPDPFFHSDLGGIHLSDQTVGQNGLVLGQRTLSPGGTLQGRVLDGNGEAVSFAFIHVEGGGSMGFGSTDPDGRFKVPGISAESGTSLDMFIDPPPGSSTVQSRTTVSWAPGQDGIHDVGNISLSAGNNLTGTVLRQDAQGDTSAVSGATVDVWPSDPIPFGGRFDTTESDGSFSISGLPDGIYDIAVRPRSGPGGFFARNVTISGADATTTITLLPASSLLVTVQNGTGAVENADVEAFNATRNIGSFGLTDASGQVTLNLPPGTYTLKVRAPGHGHEVEQGVTVGTGQTTKAVTLTAIDPGAINGTVRNGSAAVANITVVAYNTDNSFIQLFTETDSQGAFSFASIPPGPYTVFVANDDEEVGCTSVTVTGGGSSDAGELDYTAACSGGGA